MNEERISFTNSHGDTLSGVLHHPAQGASRGAVILCHGMESNKDSDKLVLLSRALAQGGVMVLRFDFRYVGESSGRFEDITYSGEVEDLTAAHSLVQSRNPGGKTAILGSSMGGTVALLFAAQEPGLAALVTVAAPIHPERFPTRVLTPAQTEEWRAQGFTRYNGQRINLSLLHDLESLNVPKAVKKITCPVLILHGDADEIVPVEEAYELNACLINSKRLSILPAADHRLSNPAAMQRAIAEALDWLTQHVS
ncbi:MAG: alpha/beta fold hydrolase [Deltaproteobacteria bacterium]|jgi:putative redox protein|nr:alpha/beta fold hydrolase [Deltaproteobacteria bacterium]MBI3064022.1 alpha/beta fold hydrolase [Deltaproteobacteria bacterium]